MCSECQKKDWPSHSMSLCKKPFDSVGLPFVLTVAKSQLNESCLRSQLTEMSLQSISAVNLKDNHNFEIILIDEAPKKVTLNDLINELANSMTLRIQLKWSNAARSVAPKANSLSVSTDLSRFLDLSDTCTNQRESSTSIHDCMRLFTEPEILSSDNPWYCSNCKAHQKAKKQMHLWKLSKYLMITLKRFHAHKASEQPYSSNNYLNYLIQNRLAYNKLNLFVQFPIK